MMYSSPQVTVIQLIPGNMVAVSIEGGSEAFTNFGDSAEKITFGNEFDW